MSGLGKPRNWYDFCVIEDLVNGAGEGDQLITIDFQQSKDKLNSNEVIWLPTTLREPENS